MSHGQEPEEARSRQERPADVSRGRRGQERPEETIHHEFPEKPVEARMRQEKPEVQIIRSIRIAAKQLFLQQFTRGHMLTVF